MSVDIARNDFFLILKGLPNVSIHTRTDALALCVFDASISTVVVIENISPHVLYVPGWPA